MESITITETKNVVTVKDPDTNLPVNITNGIIGVSGVDKPISVVTKEGDRIVFNDDGKTVTVQDKKETIQPQFREVLQVVKYTPADEEMLYLEEIDFVGDTLIYRGWADPGSLTSEPKWRIRRTRFVGTDEDVVHDWADGDTYFNNIWDNRAGLTYS